MRLNPNRGSHLPVLMKAMSLTTGPVLEMGCGTYSTQYLHWACFPTKRKLVTYENNPRYFEYIQQFVRDFHEVRCVPNYADQDLSEPWAIAFVDCDPGPRRIVVEKLLHAEYVICHDTEARASRGHQYAPIFRQFKYTWKYDETRPHTTILSNFHDLNGFTVK